MNVGPYEVIRRLGEGGMGTVDLARHCESGQTVAVKTLTRLSGPLLDALRREVWSLAKIQHPNIVRIFDHDLEAQTPWYAMEFIPGLSLRDRLSNPAQRTAIFDSDTHHIFDDTLISIDVTTLAAPVNFEKATVHNTRQSVSTARVANWLEIMKSMTSVCAALSALHEAGILHRDLKPENILYRESGEAVIVDFGISMLAQGAHGRERLTKMLRGSGTPAYLSPEQALSRPLDARADLYSLGIILFEIATGFLPFERDSVVHLLQDHVYTAAPQAKDFNRELPNGIDALITRLMSKKPSERLGFAFDVDLVLRSEFGMPAPKYTPPAYVYAPDMVGRDDSIQRLTELVRTIKRRGSGSILISGEAGVGKTRLILEFMQSIAHELPVHIGFGKQGSMSPFRAFFEVWVSLAEQDPQASEELQSKYFAWWEEISSGLRPVDHNDIPIALELFTNISRETQRLVILDDAQWLEPWSESLLEHLLANLPDGLGIIVLTRDEKSDYRCAAQISLKPLSKSETAEVIKSMVGRDDVAQLYVDFVFRETNGNPFILTELARMAMRERILHRDRAGVWNFASEKMFQTADIPASEKIVATFNEQLKHLDSGLKECLNWCACIGGATDPRLLLKVAPDVSPQKLVESSLMYWDGLRLRFKQTMMSRVLYEQMDKRQRADKHLKIARVLERIQEANPFVLGRHFFRAGAMEEAEPYLWTAYRQAMRVGIHRDVLKYFDFWVRSVTVYDETFWKKVLEVLHGDMWEHSAFAETSRFLVELVKNHDNLETQTIAYANYLLTIREESMEEKQPWIDRTIELSEMCGTDRARLSALKAVRMAMNFDTQRTMEFQREILEIAPRVNAEEHIHALMDYGRSRLFVSDYQEARELLDRANQLAQGIEIRFRIRHELTSVNAMLEGECGNPDEALKIYQSISEDVRRFSSDREMAFHHFNIAQQLISLKRYEEAREESERADLICRFLPFHQLRGLVVLHQVEIAEHLGEIQEAHRLFGRGETVFNHPKLEGFRFSHYWKYYRARFLRRIGDVDGSLNALPSLGIEPYLDACVLAERGFMALNHGEDVAAVIARFEALNTEVGFKPESEPGQLLFALKRSATARPEERFHGEHISDFPPKLREALRPD